MSCAGHQKQKPVPESACSLLVQFYSEMYPFQVKFNIYKIGAKLAHTLCIICTSNNEGIGLCFPDYDNCCVAGEKDMWCTQTALRSSCSRKDSTENPLGSRSSWRVWSSFCCTCSWLSAGCPLVCWIFREVIMVKVV